MILCCGEALIDMIPGTTSTGETAFVPHVGGSVFNTAIGLGRLGAHAGLLTGLSTDAFGRRLLEALRANNVDTAFAVLSGRPSTLAFVHLSDGEAAYDFYDENSAGRMLSPGDLPAIPDAVAALYFGGISLSTEPSAETYAGLLDRAGEGRAVMLDPNIRPGFIQDPDRFRARLGRMLALADIVKVSDADLDWLIPDPLPLRSKARILQAQGPRLVIVTRGGEGTLAFHASGAEISVPARKVVVADTVGAGDTFNAGVLHKLSELGHLTKAGIAALEEEVITKALSFGAHVASITVSRAGAQPPWASEL